MTAARRRAEAMARAVCEDTSAEPRKFTYLELAEMIEQMLDAYFARTRFRDGTGRPLRLKPEPIE